MAKLLEFCVSGPTTPMPIATLLVRPMLLLRLPPPPPLYPMPPMLELVRARDDILSLTSPLGICRMLRIALPLSNSVTAGLLRRGLEGEGAFGSGSNGASPDSARVASAHPALLSMLR